MSLSAPSVSAIQGSGLRFGVAAARYNEAYVDALVAQVTGALKEAGVRGRDMKVVRVPGSNEVPSALQLLSRTGRFDALIGLGVLVRGDTIHYELIADAATHALQHLALSLGLPVINGIVVAETAAQAEARCCGKVNRGAEFAQAALEMAALKRNLRKK